MRLTNMTLRAPLLAAALLALPLAARAQAVAGSGPSDNFKDTSTFRVPAGQKAAILEFEDLECPSCAHAAPIVKTALDHYKIPFLRHDFLIQSHLWSRDAAITARYLQDKVSPDVAEQYRRDVFAAQTSIASKEDLQAFTRQWFAKARQPLPFVMDPSGRFALEVESDVNLGVRIGVARTPTIIVLGQKGWIQVTDVTQLYTSIDQALAQVPSAPAKAAPVAKKPVHKATGMK